MNTRELMKAYQAFVREGNKKNAAALVAKHKGNKRFLSLVDLRLQRL